MVEEVKLTVPVVADLRSGTLTDRHWEVLDDVLAVDIRGQGSVTFKQMMEVRVLDTMLFVGYISYTLCGL